MDFRRQMAGVVYYLLFLYFNYTTMKNSKFSKFIVVTLSTLVMVAFMHINFNHNAISASTGEKNYAVELEERNEIMHEVKIVKFILVKIFQTYEFDRKV